MSRAARRAAVEPEWEYVVDPDAPPADLRQLDRCLAALLLDLVDQDEATEKRCEAKAAS